MREIEKYDNLAKAEMDYTKLFKSIDKNNRGYVFAYEIIPALKKRKIDYSDQPSLFEA